MSDRIPKLKCGRCGIISQRYSGFKTPIDNETLKNDILEESTFFNKGTIAKALDVVHEQSIEIVLCSRCQSDLFRMLPTKSEVKKLLEMTDDEYDTVINRDITIKVR